MRQAEKLNSIVRLQGTEMDLAGGDERCQKSFCKLGYKTEKSGMWVARPADGVLQGEMKGDIQESPVSYTRGL